MAIQLEVLDLERGHSVLEIGAGTGYNAALMGVLVGKRGEVTSIDIDADLVLEASKILARVGASNVCVLQADGFAGCLAYAPYDGILATCSVRSIPRAWVDQLKHRGLLVCNMVTSLASLSDGQVQLYLLINDTAIQVKDDVLTMYGNHAWAEQQIEQSLDLYRQLGQPPITEHHVSIQEQQVIACIADHLVHLVP